MTGNLRIFPSGNILIPMGAIFRILLKDCDYITQSGEAACVGHIHASGYINACDLSTKGFTHGNLIWLLRNVPICTNFTWQLVFI